MPSSPYQTVHLVAPAKRRTSVDMATAWRGTCKEWRVVKGGEKTYLRVRRAVSSVPGGACECPTTTSTGASSCHAPPYPIHITPLGTSLYTDRASGLPGPDLLEQMEILIERS